MFNGPQETYLEVYCDICTVPVRTDNQVTMVDLDLDVVRRWDGVVEILDEDEFEIHQVTYGYSPEVIASARKAADELAEIVRSGAEPFATAYKPWLAKVS
ncbi:DUF402 domain-containing protein [Fodinicola feengrottensis]|uniref:DUF402 domain-containing protein n=1 Tax=Fodinicola feengrottensis TaxID=435914 RepID=UPI0024410095|nr:DUF402 domain-containing protein [Fodinicola feengrottensis]